MSHGAVISVADDCQPPGRGLRPAISGIFSVAHTAHTLPVAAVLQKARKWATPEKRGFVVQNLLSIRL